TDLTLFEFDYDNTWAAFFLSPDEKIYGRYGGRDSKGPDNRMSLIGLNYAMQSALEAHHKNTDSKPRVAKPQRIDDLAGSRRRGCIHCHQVAEIQRDVARADGHWAREDRWVYPLPENVGLTLEVDRGNSVKTVQADSPAAGAGLQPSDVLRSL